MKQGLNAQEFYFEIKKFCEETPLYLLLAVRDVIDKHLEKRHANSFLNGEAKYWDEVISAMEGDTND